MSILDGQCPKCDKYDCDCKAETIKELRIGNIIISGNNGRFDSDGSIGKVLEIGNADREFEQVYCECDESFEWFFKNNYFGVPITEEWLLKLGFYKPASSWGNYVRKGFESPAGYNWHITPYKDTCFRVEWHKGNDYLLIREVKYIHELQNLFFALTGRELEARI